MGATHEERGTGMTPFMCKQAFTEILNSVICHEESIRMRDDALNMPAYSCDCTVDLVYTSSSTVVQIQILTQNKCIFLVPIR